MVVPVGKQRLVGVDSDEVEDVHEVEVCRVGVPLEVNRCQRPERHHDVSGFVEAVVVTWRHSLCKKH